MHCSITHFLSYNHKTYTKHETVNYINFVEFCYIYMASIQTTRLSKLKYLIRNLTENI